MIDERTFEPKILSKTIKEYEDSNFYQDTGLDQNLEL